VVEAAVKAARSLYIAEKALATMASTVHAGEAGKRRDVKQPAEEALRAATMGLAACQGSLGPSHVIRMRLLGCQLRACTELAMWAEAREAARELLPLYEACYPPNTPPLGLHYALLAKLEAALPTVEGGQPQVAREWASRAQDMLQLTHPKEGHVLREMDRICAEAEMEMMHLAHEGAARACDGGVDDGRGRS